jgi:hypothetical protein
MDLLSNRLVRELKKQNEFLSKENNKIKTSLDLMRRMNETLLKIKINLENNINLIIRLFCDSIEMPQEFESNSIIVTKLSQEFEELKNQLECCDSQSFIDNSILNNNQFIAQSLIDFDFDSINFETGFYNSFLLLFNN